MVNLGNTEYYLVGASDMRTGPKLVEIRSSPSSFRILTEFVRILDSFLFYNNKKINLKVIM